MVSLPLARLVYTKGKQTAITLNGSPDSRGRKRSRTSSSLGDAVKSQHQRNDGSSIISVNVVTKSPGLRSSPAIRATTLVEKAASTAEDFIVSPCSE